MKSPSPKRSDVRGVTLIELMVVLVIVTIGFLTLSAVQTRSARDVTGTGLHTRAMEVGHQRMEIARAAGFEAGARNDSGTVDVFNWRCETDTVSQGLLSIAVTVTWTAQGTQSIRLDNLVSTR